ncbi:MAG: hypothetical protein QW607_04210 [Desulfurococcaceae archaeon]
MENLEIYIYDIPIYTFIEPYKKINNDVKCFYFTGNFYLECISDIDDTYFKFTTNETIENYNLFSCLTLQDDDKINLLYLTEFVFGKTVEEFIIAVEYLDNDGNVKYKTFNTVASESITINLSELYYNQIIHAYQLNLYFGINIKYPMVCYFDIYEMNWFGRLLTESNYVEKIKTLINKGDIAISFNNSNLFFNDNKTKKFRLLPQETIIPVRIFIGKDVIDSGNLTHLAIIFNGICELDILKEINYPIYVINDVSFRKVVFGF